MLGGKQSQIQQFLQIQGQITCPIRSIIEIIYDLMVTNIFTKFGANCIIFVDARV